jgi:hypothetical protein
VDYISRLRPVHAAAPPAQIAHTQLDDFRRCGSARPGPVASMTSGQTK